MLNKIFRTSGTSNILSTPNVKLLIFLKFKNIEPTMLEMHIITEHSMKSILFRSMQLSVIIPSPAK
ncbi:hypothetical protein [Ruminococcoides intestinale]|uniref:hypothetical protein n=1 Tax=Ruminococcoides intestinale TaxID=3133162 RepID=UPI0032D47627